MNLLTKSGWYLLNLLYKLFFVFRKFHLQEEFEKANGEEEDSESDSDAEFDGGLKVPKKLWKKLYK